MTASRAAGVGASRIGSCGACVRCGHDGGYCIIRKRRRRFTGVVTFFAVRSLSGSFPPAPVATDGERNRQSL